MGEGHAGGMWALAVGTAALAVMLGVAPPSPASATTPPPPPPETTAPPAPTPTPTPTPTPAPTTEVPPATTTSVEPPTTDAPIGTVAPPGPSAPSDLPTTDATVLIGENTDPPAEDLLLASAATETAAESSSPVRLADGHVTRSIVFPVLGGYWLGSGWNDIRADGARFHHGVDVIASAGQPVVSPVDGRVSAIYRRHPTIGHGVMVTDDRGYSYRLFHMASDLPDDLRVGERVIAGQLLGFVGGDQAIHHVHVELLRPSGVQINPYWSLTAGRFGDYPCADPAAVTSEWSAHAGTLVSPDQRHYVLLDPSLCRPPPPPPPPAPPPPPPPAIPRVGGPGAPLCRPV